MSNFASWMSQERLRRVVIMQVLSWLEFSWTNSNVVRQSTLVQAGRAVVRCSECTWECVLCRGFFFTHPSQLTRRLCEMGGSFIRDPLLTTCMMGYIFIIISLSLNQIIHSYFCHVDLCCLVIWKLKMLILFYFTVVKLCIYKLLDKLN